MQCDDGDDNVWLGQREENFIGGTVSWNFLISRKGRAQMREYELILVYILSRVTEGNLGLYTRLGLQADLRYSCILPGEKVHHAICTRSFDPTNNRGRCALQDLWFNVQVGQHFKGLYEGCI